eukprot:988482-Prorocentrum_minimum.AAC.1
MFVSTDRIVDGRSIVDETAVRSLTKRRSRSPRPFCSVAGAHVCALTSKHTKRNSACAARLLRSICAVVTAPFTRHARRRRLASGHVLPDPY